jgi:hypothetical protein
VWRMDYWSDGSVSDPLGQFQIRLTEPRSNTNLAR